MIASFHNHSKWSDGQTSFEEMFNFAKASNVDILGVSDHLCIYPDGTSPYWSVPLPDINDYIADVLSYRSGEVEIRVGIEYDWFEGHEARIRPVVEGIDLDYRIGAVHHVDLQQFDTGPEYWTEKSAEERDAIWIKYWRMIEEMAQSGLFDIAAHLDYPKKLGFYPESDIDSVIDPALVAIRDNNMTVELNTLGFSKECADGYPSVDILKKCCKLEIPATLSADGHHADQILFGFERGLKNLKEAGYKEIARFRERETWLEPLDAALLSARAS